MSVLTSPSADFWQGKRVFLTGHTGFKGAWLALWLSRLGATVRGFSLPVGPENPLFSASRIREKVESLEGDIRDPAALEQALVAFKPDVVLHLAAQALVQRSYTQPVETFDTNVMGTIRLLEAVRRAPTVRAVVVVTTDKCYENREWLWAYRENEALGGRDPYSASKAGTELAVGAWRASFFNGSGVALASARAGNVIGGGDWADNRLVPDCVRALRVRDAIEIRSPNATRPWQHVLEPLCGYLILAERLWGGGEAFAEAWNFGPALVDVWTVGQVVERVTELWGDGAQWKIVGHDGGHEAGLLAVDSSKAQSRLQWRPRLGTETALNWTVQWYKRHAAGEDAQGLVLDDIARFEQVGTDTP